MACVLKKPLKIIKAGACKIISYQVYFADHFFSEIIGFLGFRLFNIKRYKTSFDKTLDFS